MAYHLGDESVARFRRFLARERNADGTLLFSECPNLDERGCSVHEFRPLSCRLYGLFRAQSAPLIEHCAFRGKETIFPDEQEHLFTPGQSRLAELSIEYLSYFPPGAGAVESLRLKPPQTDLEMASHLQVTRDYPAAIELLLKLRQGEDSATVTLMLSECYEHVKDYGAAIATLDEAIARSPDNPELYTRKGRNCLFAGRLPEARQALARSLEMAEDRRNAQGLLGFVLQLSGELEGAERHLTRAVELEDEPGPFRFQLALVLKSLGKLQACREMLERAREYAPHAQQAEQTLAELAALP